MSKIKAFIDWLVHTWRNQPDISLIHHLPKPNNKTEPFELRGEILFNDEITRTITKSGNSYHITLPPFWKNFLSSDMKAWLFEAQGKRGLIYVCEGKVNA